MTIAKRRSGAGTLEHGAPVLLAVRKVIGMDKEECVASDQRFCGMPQQRRDRRADVLETVLVVENGDQIRRVLGNEAVARLNFAQLLFGAALRLDRPPLADGTLRHMGQIGECGITLHNTLIAS